MKDIVLLHGALGDESQMFALKEELSSRFNCYTFTFHGHGERAEENKAFSISSFAEELKVFILENRISGCDIFGYSMGGFVSIYLANKNPSLIKKVVIYGTQLNWTPEISKKETRRLNPEVIVSKVPAFADALENTHGTHWKCVLKRTAKLMTDLGTKNPLNEDFLQSIQTEIIILRGSEDKMVEKNYSQNVSLLLPSSSFHEIEGAPHPLQQVDIKKLAPYIV